VPYKEFQTVQKPQWGVLQLQLDHIERMLVLGPMCESWNSRGRMHYFNENHLESASQASQTQPLQVSLFVLHMIKATTGGGKELALTLTPSTFSRCRPTDDVWICPSDGHDKKLHWQALLMLLMSYCSLGLGLQVGTTALRVSSLSPVSRRSEQFHKDICRPRVCMSRAGEFLRYKGH
jgi:hypothetical protein